MNKLLALFVASAFALGSASGIAAEPAKKKEELTAEQKTEIRDRVERLKAERAKADQAKAAPAPAKADAPKKTSKSTTKRTHAAKVSPATPAVKKAAPKV